MIFQAKFISDSHFYSYSVVCSELTRSVIKSKHVVLHFVVDDLAKF